MKISFVERACSNRQPASQLEVRPRPSSSCSIVGASRTRDEDEREDEWQKVIPTIATGAGLCPVLSVSAFTLIEVMIAMFIFAIVAFAVLELMVVSLGAARALQMPEADAGMVAAELSLSNNLVEETVSGDFDLFPNYSWERDVSEINTNGLYQVDITVVHKLPRRGATETKMSVLMFRTPTGPAGFGAGRRRF